MRRLFVPPAPAAGAPRKEGSRPMPDASHQRDPPHRRSTSAIAAQHRGHGGRQGRGRVRRRRSPAWSCRASTSTCAPIPGQELIQQDIREHELNRDRRGLLLAAAARAHLPRRDGAGRAEPLLLPDGQHPGERLLGARRPRSRPRKRPRTSPAAAIRRVAHHKALEPKKVPINPDVLVVGGGIAGHPRRADPGQRRQEGLSRRARADHRRPHGHVRQDLPDARLRRLHPDAEDVGGQDPPQHHPLDLLRGGQASRATSATTRSR